MAYPNQDTNCINPADLLSFASYAAPEPVTRKDDSTKNDVDFTFDLNPFAFSASADEYRSDLTHTHTDSGVDLRQYYNTPEQLFPRVKTEFSGDFDNLINTPYSTPASNTSNTPSPHNDMIFSNANSPGDYTRDQSQTSSPEAIHDFVVKDIWDPLSSAEDGIMIPQSIDPPSVTILFDKNKTRAETQIKTNLILDPLPRQIQWIRFPRHTLSKSKQLATDEEIEANEDGGSAVRAHLTLVCATAVEKRDGLDRAMRRARGEEPLPRRPRTTQVSEIEKDDPAHPQNGGAVVICEGCKERERKRYDRKKKRNQDEETEWINYEDDRIIMINDKEFKRWQDVENSDAKKIEFAMRITCYCRHQEEKNPVGYRVIFTFKDVQNNVLAQKLSEVIQITDDHKNRELPQVDAITTDLSIHPPTHQESMPNHFNMGMYNHNSQQPVYGMYSQPTTPVVPQFNPLSPMDTLYSQGTNPVNSSQPIQSSFTFAAGPMPTPTAPPYTHHANHQRFQSYSNTPMLSPTEQLVSPVGFSLQRPHSMDSFAHAFSHMYSQPNQYTQSFASQPPSRNVSRPASPSWEQGASRSKKMRAVPAFLFGEDPEEEG